MSRTQQVQLTHVGTTTANIVTVMFYTETAYALLLDNGTVQLSDHTVHQFPEPVIDMTHYDNQIYCLLQSRTVQKIEPL